MTLTTAQFPCLSAILICCAAGLMMVLLFPAEKSRAIKWISAVTAGVTLALSFYLFLTYNRELGGIQFVEKHTWIKALGISYFNGLDGFSVPLLLLTGIVFFTGVLTMWDLEHRVKEFFALVILLVMAVFGMFMALDLFFIFVWYDVSLLPMYLLIAVWGGTRKEYGAMKLMLYLLAGSALILPGIIYLVTQSGLKTFDLILLVNQANFTPFTQKLVFLFFFLGFGVLAGVWPFHTWSPVGHVAAPTAVSMIHAGVLMKIGAFGILRLGIYLCPLGWVFWAPLMAVLAVVGIVYGALAGLRQTDLKYVVGYSSVSHMGIVGLGLATMTPEGLNGAVFQMFAHGVMTALFFSSIGYIYDRTHTKAIPELGGLSHVLPRASAYFITAALAGIGVPCLASFWAELPVFIATFKVYPLLACLAVSALVISALFFLRVIRNTCYGPPLQRFSQLKDMSPVRQLPRMILAGTILAFGLFPFLMYDTIQTATMTVINLIP